MDSNLVMECVEDALEPWQWFDGDVQEEGMGEEEDNMVTEGSDNRCAASPSSPETSHPSASISVSQPATQCAQATILNASCLSVEGTTTLLSTTSPPVTVTVSVQPTTMAPVVSSAPISTGTPLLPAGMAPGQKLILTQAPEGLGTILLPAVTPGNHPALNQPIFLTTEGFPVQNGSSAQSPANPLRLVLNMQQSPGLQPITLLTGSPDGRIFKPTLLPKPEPDEVSLQPGQISPQLQNPQVGATSAPAQPALTSTTTTTDTRPTAAPTDCTPDLTSHTLKELCPDREIKVEEIGDEIMVETPGDLNLSSSWQRPIDMGSGDLEYLLKADFTKLPFEQQLKITQDGRPTPSLERMKTPRTKGKCRTFSDENYTRTEWLAGSDKLQKLFCWPCLLFDLTTCSPNNPWVTTGYDDLNNFHKAVQKHSKSRNHLGAAVKLKRFGRVKIEEAPVVSVQRHNAQVSKNRELIKKLTIAALYLARQEQAFRGHDESASRSNRGNFVELVHAFAEFDTMLAENLGSSTVFSGISATIQDDIIESIARVIQDEVDKELGTAPFIAVEVDDTSDISCKSQLTVIIRYVNERGAIRERFLGFFDVSSDRDADAIATVVMRAIGNYSPASKLVCQTYDGASCMSGQQGGVKALVKSHCHNALFFHCYAHELNQVLAQGTGSIQAAKLFFASLDMFNNFFSSSCKRTALLCDVDSSTSVPEGSATRWNFKSRAVHDIHKGRRSLCLAFDRIMTEPGWDKEAIAQSAALKQKLEEFDFVFLLGVFQAIFDITEPLVKVLQNKKLDIRKCREQVKDMLSSLKVIRSDRRFLRIYEEAVQTVGTPSDRQRKRRRLDWSDNLLKVEQGEEQEDQSPVDSCRRLYNEVLDGVVLHMSHRFADVKKLDFFYLMDHSHFPSYSESTFPNTELSQLFTTYPFFDQQRLKNELQVIYGDTFFHKPPRELVELLIKEDLSTTLPEVLSLLKLMLTIPITSAERSFSCLKGIKTFIRNTRGQERLVHLAKISMGSSVVEELKTSGKLYDRVTECFASMKERTMPLLFK